MTKTTNNTKTTETETSTIPGLEVTKGDLPEVGRKGFSRRSKYDFLANLTPDELATFTVENDKKAATLRTTLFGWSKRHEGIKLKTAYDREQKKVFIKVIREELDKGE